MVALEGLSSEPPLPREPELAGYARQAREQRQEIAGLVEMLADAQLWWRPGEGRWSIGEHVDHLPRAAAAYHTAIDAAIERARAAGWLAAGPYRHGWIGTWFRRSMEPPVRVRVRTLPSLEPVAARPKAALLEDYLRAHREFDALLLRADGVDLARARLRSPLLKLLRLSVGQALAVLLAHERRHAWHMRKVLSNPAFPASPPGR